MSPAWVVLALLLILRVLGEVQVPALDSWLVCVRWATGVTFIGMGLAHLTPIGRDVRRLVPPAFRRPTLVILILGLWQIAGGVGLINSATRTAAAIGLSILLLLKLPANVRAARKSLRLKGRFATSPRWRIPAQFLWLALVWWSAL